MQTSGARNTDPSRKNAHQYRPLTQALRDRGCRRDARERGGKRVDAQFTSNPKQPHGDKSEYRPLTQSRERVGASPREYRPFAQDSHRAENVGCGSIERWPRDLSASAAAKEYRPLTQESAVRASKIQTFRTRNADRSRKGYRPFAQRIPTFRARDYRPRAQGITDSPRKNGAEYRPLAQVIPTSRARTRRETPANRCILPIGSPFHVVVVCV